MRSAILAKGRALAVLWVVHGILSYVFGAHTPGLGFPESLEPTGIAYVTHLHSSGRNDNVAVGMGAIFAIIAVIWSSVRFKKYTAADVIAHLLLLLLQTVYIFSVEEGSFLFTITRGRNIVLALWIVSYIALWVTLGATVVSAARTRFVTLDRNHT